jgi:tetraacyldisaccharide 4'-kinase
MLPWGRLRDLPSRALKADTIVVTKCPDTIRPIDMRVVDNRLHMPSYQNLHFAGIEYAPINQKGTPLVVCGIAQPQHLLDHVRAQYTQAQMLSFPDHHAFTPQEVDKIIESAGHFDFVLTTEKDMQRLRETDLEQQLAQQGKPLVTLPIRMRFCTPPKDFDRFILNYVHENCRK